MFFSGYGKAIKEVRFGASKRLLVFVGNGGIYYRAGGTETKKIPQPGKVAVFGYVYCSKISCARDEVCEQSRLCSTFRCCG